MSNDHCPDAARLIAMQADSNSSAVLYVYGIYPAPANFNHESVRKRPIHVEIDRC